MTLLAAYSFGGTGSTIADDSGNGHNFTLDANTVRAAGGGLTRTTTGQTVGPAVFGQTANRSISGRLVRTSTALDAWFPAWDNGGTGSWGLIDLSGQRQARARNAGGAAAAQVAATTGEVAFACTYDGSNIRLYIGGSLVATTALAGPLLTTATNLYILNGSGTETVLKDLRVYDHTLTLAEVQADRDNPVTPGGSIISGAITANLPAFTGALTGNAAARGTAAGPIPAMVGAFTGSATVEASEDGLLPALIGTFAAGLTASGAVNGQLPALLGAFTGNGEADGAVAGPLPGFVGAFTGSVSPPPSAVLAAFLPALHAAFAGNIGPLTPYTPITDPTSAIRPNLATATPRDNTATAVIRANSAEAAP